MTKYQKGQRVRIVSREILERNSSLFPGTDKKMQDLAGMTGVVSTIYENYSVGENTANLYILEPPYHMCVWREEWLKPVNPVLQDDIQSLLKGGSYAGA